MFLHAAMPTINVTEQREKEEISVGGIAGVTISLVFMTVVTVVGFIVVVWLLKRYFVLWTELT